MNNPNGNSLALDKKSETSAVLLSKKSNNFSMGTKNLFVKTLVVLALVLTAATDVKAQVYANSSTGDDAAGTGTLLSPVKTFHKAYQLASAGGTINLSGTFDWTDAGETGDVVTSGYAIAKNLTIVGQGSDQTTIQAHPTANTTERRVFTINSGASVTIEKVTIRNGRVANIINNSVYPADGGGIYNEGNLTLNYCRFTENYSLAAGSYSGGAGGALKHTANNTLTIYGCTFDNNQAKIGGALSNDFDISNGRFIITNSTFAFNKQLGTLATVGGGAIWIGNAGATNVITNSTFHANLLTVGTGKGASIFMRRGSVRIKNSIFANGIEGSSALGVYESEIGIDEGSATDEGNNIIGKQYDGITSPKTTSYYDSYTSTSAPDGIFTKYINGKFNAFKVPISILR